MVLYFVEKCNQIQTNIHYPM